MLGSIVRQSPRALVHSWPTLRDAWWASCTGCLLHESCAWPSMYINADSCCEWMIIGRKCRTKRIGDHGEPYGRPPVLDFARHNLRGRMWLCHAPFFKQISVFQSTMFWTLAECPEGWQLARLEGVSLLIKPSNTVRT